MSNRPPSPRQIQGGGVDSSALKRQETTAPHPDCVENSPLSTQTPQEAVRELAEAAVEWWLCLRPLDFSEAEHFANPTINCSNDRERAIATCVADLLRSERDI